MIKILTALSFVLLAAACGETTGSSAPPAASASAAPAAQPSPKAPPTVATLAGTGSKVNPGIVIPQGTWQVTWTATGQCYFGVDALGAGTEQSPIVNEVSDGGTIKGDAVFMSGGGTFIIQVTASGCNWSLVWTYLSR